MTELPSTFVAAVGLSLAFCVPVGSVTAEALRRGLLRGFRPVLWFELGALAGSSVWAAVSVAGLTALVHTRPLHLLLGVVGLMLVWRMAWQAFADACTGRMPAARPGAVQDDFLAGVVICLANPFAVAFWLGAGAGLVPEGSAPSSAQAVTLLGGFLAGSLVYRVALALLIGWGRRFLTEVSVRWVNGLSGALLAGFGIRLLLNTLRLV